MALADLLIQTQQYRAAGEQYRQVLSVEPNNVNALNNLACVLISCADRNARDGEEAVKLAERACELTAFKEPGFMRTLAAARAERDRMAAAEATSVASSPQVAEDGDEFDD
jgi:Tfp pilus assembly protein PilF